MFLIASKLVSFIIRAFYLLTGNKLPQFVSVAAIIQNEKHEFLLQKRADNRGYCLPGGLTKVGETLEENIKREVLEETGYKISFPRFLFYKNVNMIYKYSLLIVYEVKIESGNLKSSWEGEAVWKNFKDIQYRMAFEHEKVIQRYLEELNSQKN